MKKTFSLTHEKKALPRVIEAVKNEVRKYVKRERAKALPEGADYWDFDCRFGLDAASSKPVHLAEIDTLLNQAEAQQATACYIEILAKPATRSAKA
jgi:hypothetical protein